MKTSKYIFCIMALSLLMGGCQKNPLDDVEDGGWNKEKRIIGLTFKDQAGNATININADDSSKGTVGVTIVNPDFSKYLVIKKMEVSYQSKASVNAGDSIKFDPISHSATISVLSASGETREYTVTVTPLVEDLIGTWSINELDIFGGTGPYYGGAGFVNLSGDPSWWDATTGVAAELDNTLEFTFEGVTDSGQTYGTCVNNPGPDGKYANFVWTGDIPKGNTLVDVNYNYQKIPQGTSTWTRDYSAGTITFTKDKESAVASFVNSGQITYWGKTLNVTDNALKFSGLKAAGGWGPIYTAYDQIVYAPWDYYIQIKKK
jgi:hypothetical protein